MFQSHFHNPFRQEHSGGCRERGFARFGGDRGGHGFGRGFGREFGGGPRERMFDNGELQLVILHLLAEKPSYGYELIKTMETRLAGGYAPSPGVIYPTLTMLEEEGFTTSETTDGGKKVYTVTEAGRQQLAERARVLEEILARMQQASQGFERGRSPELMRSFMNLRMAIKTRMTRGRPTPEQLKAIAAAIDQAAKTIDEL